VHRRVAPKEERERVTTMGSIGAPELLVIALLALLLFGAGRIADIGKGLGQGIKNFKQGLKEANDDDDKDEKAEKSEKSDKKEAKSKPKDESPKEA
jgi:sec-independent protein translocase protein TatA